MEDAERVVTDEVVNELTVENGMAAMVVVEGAMDEVD